MSPERRKPPPHSPSGSDLSPRYSSASYSPRRNRHRHRRLSSPDSARDGAVDSDYLGSSRSPYDSGEDEYEYEDDNPASEDVGTRRGSGSGSVPMQFPEPKASSNLTKLPGPTPYVHVAPMPVFRGAPEECPVAHLSRFAKVCRANNADSPDAMMRIFPVTLEREAALWYDLNIEPYRPSLGWDDVRASFAQAYQKAELQDQLRSQLATLNQGRGECVRSYFLRLQLILQRWPDHGLPEGLVRGIFLDGLSGELQEWVLPQRPESLDDALRLAIGYEQVKGVKGPGPGPGGECGFCGGPHEEQEGGCEVRERMRALWLESKEKAMGVGLVKERESESESGAGDRSEAAGGSASFGAISLRRSLCQCWKHQCSRKRLERSKSLAT
ncbi:hypothetical protein ACJRO7_001921 [Eucalyptus globulus]|uniref:Retrotransposon gag domain-containing protein n=1 Tax=Eucalyptus globulus TaxID=34317 RepID=A0ABD3LSM1_EUCGL